MLRLGLVEPGWTFLFTLVNFGIIYLILKKILFQPVIEFMDNREKAINGSLDEADEKLKSAEEYKEEYEQKLQKADDEGRQIIRKASVRADELAAERKDEARKEIEEMKAKAAKDIELEKTKAINSLKDEISSMAILAASKVIEKDVDEKEHGQMLDEFISKVGDTKWQN